MVSHCSFCLPVPMVFLPVCADLTGRLATYPLSDVAPAQLVRVATRTRWHPSLLHNCQDLALADQSVL